MAPRDKMESAWFLSANHRREGSLKMCLFGLLSICSESTLCYENAEAGRDTKLAERILSLLRCCCSLDLEHSSKVCELTS